MENQNILTIKFNTLDDLAVQVADWNERLNHQCQGQCMSEKPIVKVTSGTSLELAESKLEDTFKKAIEKGSKKIAEGITRLEAEGCKVEILENEVTAPADDVPVTDFEGKPTKTKKEKKVEPIDKKAFYKEFREWMGEDGVKAKKALAIFSKHGVTRPSSDSLTDDIITDLKSAMAGEE